MFEGKAVEIVNGWRFLGSLVGNEKVYENFIVNTADKYSNLLEKMGQVAKTSHQNAYACLMRDVQQKSNSVSPTQLNSRNIFTEAEDNIQTHILPSFFNSPVSQSAPWLYSLPTREGRPNMKKPTEYETEKTASLTTCNPLEDEDRANALLTQEGITQDQQTACLNIIRSR